MKPTDEDLVLYADNALSPERKQLLQNAAKNDENLAEILVALEGSRLPYKAAFDQQTLPPVPDDLRLKVRNMSNVVAEETSELSHASQNQQMWPMRFAQAACLVLCLGVGYWGGINTQGGKSTLSDADIASVKIDDVQTQWVTRVVDYQSLYVSNTVEGIKVDMQASVEKLNKLAELHEMDVAIPDFSAEGYQFTRAQELGFNGKPLVQLVYTKEGFPPLALCFMPADGEADQALSVALHHGLGAANWISGDQRFVLVAEESSETLEGLYTSVASVFPGA